MLKKLLKALGVCVAASSIGAPPGTALAATSATTVTPFSSHVGMAAAPDGKGYWVTGIHGGVYTFGDARFYGSLPGERVSVSNIVGISSTPDGRGYWLYGSDGGVFTFGDARFFGSLRGFLKRPAPHAVVDFASTPDGGGYWLLAADGGVFTFGDAQFYGSLRGRHVAPIPARLAESESYHAYVSSDQLFFAPTPNGRGYWIVDSSGNVSTFGQAKWYGSLRANIPSAAEFPGFTAAGHAETPAIAAFAATRDGKGYWMAATDGRVYPFGDAKTYGSLPEVHIDVPSNTVIGYTPPTAVYLNVPLSSAGNFVATPDGRGYWIASLNGGVFSFGDAHFYGSLPGIGISLQTIDSYARSAG
jgi:hypothetical protein